MTDLKELRKKAMEDPQSLSESQWEQIHKVAFSVPKKDFYDDDQPPAIQKTHEQKKKGSSWW